MELQAWVERMGRDGRRGRRQQGGDQEEGKVLCLISWTRIWRNKSTEDNGMVINRLDNNHLMKWNPTKADGWEGSP